MQHILTILLLLLMEVLTVRWGGFSCVMQHSSVDKGSWFWVEEEDESCPVNDHPFHHCSWHHFGWYLDMLLLPQAKTQKMS